MYSVELDLKAGTGGDGLASFFREKFIPLGGPDGGDGGRGGDIYLEADANIRDLSAYRNKKIFRAEAGKSGGKQKMHGRDGESLVLYVPPGTIVEKVEKGGRVFLADLVDDKDRIRVGRGGKGGAGNVHFATATDQAPRRAGKGAPGAELRIRLDLRLPTDICIIGVANSGKSTLLSRLTGAMPKIADYPFTTQEIVLGSADLGKEMITMAELPALVKGASTGKGLGNDFLRHAMRSHCLILLIDGSSASPRAEIDMLIEELHEYSGVLANKPRIVALNKVDLQDVKQKEAEALNYLKNYAFRVYGISALKGIGVSDLMEGVKELLRETPRQAEGGKAEAFVFHPRPISQKEKK